MRLVYLSPVTWSSFAQRPQKFVEWFHQNTKGEVLWIEPYPTRLPTIKDLAKLKKNKQYFENSRPPSWIKIVQPSVLPIEPILHLGFINRLLWRNVIDAVGEFTDNQKSLIVIGKPSILALDILKRFKNFPSRYDAMDFFPAFYRGVSRKSMSKIESEIANSVKVVWASSTDLAIYWKERCKKVREIKNGFDSILITPNSSPKQNTSRKVFGYVGTISSWFDWDFVIKLAHKRKDDLIRVIGPISKFPPITLPANIELLPACDHEIAISLMRKFDVGIIPFLKTDLTQCVDPIKYYEYRALGMPVLSSNFGEMRYKIKDPGIFLVSRYQDIGLMAEAAVNFENGHENYDQFCVKFSWCARFDAGDIFNE